MGLAGHNKSGSNSLLCTCILNSEYWTSGTGTELQPTYPFDLVFQQVDLLQYEQTRAGRRRFCNPPVPPTDRLPGYRLHPHRRTISAPVQRAGGRATVLRALVRACRISDASNRLCKVRNW